MLPVSAISDTANKLRNLLLGQIEDLDGGDQIRIGHPNNTFSEMPAEKNHLNLFFYNVGYDGYPADGLSEDPFYVRLYCLITAVGGKTVSPSTGENDLRLIGEVMRILHENPIISIDDLNNSEIAQLQIVPHPLNLDNLNHIWSTQGDTAYRLSVAYEMALAPIPLTRKVERSLRVGEIGAKAQGNTSRGLLPDDGLDMAVSAPFVPKVTVDYSGQDWSPHISFVDEINRNLAYTLSIPESQLPSSGNLQLKALVAGKPSQQVALVWEFWNTVDGWKRSSTSQNETIETDTVDANQFFNPLDPSLITEINLPIQGKGQASLYAERTWERADGSTAILRSNPLLVTVYEEGS